MQKVTLNTVYINYQVTNGVEKEFYGTLYKLMGGKKDIDEIYYTLEMRLFIHSIERIHRARGNFDKLLKEQENELKALDNEEQKILTMSNHRYKQTEFYIKRFKQTLDYYVAMIKLTIKDNSDVCYFERKYTYTLLFNNNMIAVGKIDLDMNSIFEEMRDNFIRIFKSLKGAMGKDISKIQYNTMKKIEKDLIYMLENNLKFK